MTTRSPLIVDMDGSYLRTDTLAETLVELIFRRPSSILPVLGSLIRGRASFKSAATRAVSLDVKSLPVRHGLADYVAQAHRDGRPTYLVSAANANIVEAVAAEAGVFTGAKGSDDALNLKGSVKRDFLKREFPEGFVYAGDSTADLDVWKAAKGVIIAGASKSTAARARRLGVPVEAEFCDERPSVLRLWRKALRVHQWSKNVLLFAPLFLAHAYDDFDAMLRVLIGFLLVSLAASGSYVINDLADLASDRAHRSKSDRPFASGGLPVFHGLLVGPVLMAGGLGGAFLLDWNFGYCLLVYLAISISYSLSLKRVVLADAFILSSLYTMRLLMGVTLVEASVSEWLMTFSLFFFLSMSLAKRHVELVAARETGNLGTIAGRGYRGADWPLTLALGVASSTASVLVMILYFVEDAMPTGAYSSPEFLWGAPALTALWTSRIWLLANRGELDDDPVAFALKDRVSILLGIVLAAAFFAAALL